MEGTIVLYPLPEIGHLVSMVELGKLILRRKTSLSVTILLLSGPFETAATSSYIHSISQTHPSISFRSLPPLSGGLDAAPTWSREARMFRYINRSAATVLQSVQEISRATTVRALIIDLFCASALSVGTDMGVPTFFFITSGAAILAAFLYFPTIHAQFSESFKNLKDTVLEFPGLPPIKATQMIEPTLDRDDPAYDAMVYFCSNLPKSDGVLVNTFEELEPRAVGVLASGACVPDSPTPPVYYIGPLLAQESYTDHDCLTWLAKQPSKSVVFLCFGSRGSFSLAQVEEIAKGLEMSGHRFLWVVKTKQTVEGTEFDLEKILPDGFLERTKERGLVVKPWVPQVAVLSQESVGGFVTHCGWNSVLEALVAGVPMVGWPLYAEQFLNRACLVEDMKMAIPVDQRDDDGFVSGDELEKRIRELMDTEQGQELRQRSKMMKEKAMDARGELGSSTRALNKLIQVMWH